MWSRFLLGVDETKEEVSSRSIHNRIDLTCSYLIWVTNYMYIICGQLKKVLQFYSVKTYTPIWFATLCCENKTKTTILVTFLQSFFAVFCCSWLPHFVAHIQTLKQVVVCERIWCWAYCIPLRKNLGLSGVWFFETRVVFHRSNQPVKIRWHSV